jgi:cytoskeleton protein RodZ
MFDNKVNSEKKPSNSPGALLRWGREQRNLSIEEIASELHLTKVRVIAIEEDDFSSFSGETFVRGYLRLYARVIGIDEKEVVGPP